MLTTFNLNKREDYHHNQTTPSEGRLMMANPPHSKKTVAIVCGCIFGIPAAVLIVLVLSAISGGMGYAIGGPLWAHANGSSGMLIAGKVLVAWGAVCSGISFLFYSTAAVGIGIVIAVAVASSDSSTTPTVGPTHGNNSGYPPGSTAAGRRARERNLPTIAEQMEQMGFGQHGNT